MTDQGGKAAGAHSQGPLRSPTSRLPSQDAVPSDQLNQTTEPKVHNNEACPDSDQQGSAAQAAEDDHADLTQPGQQPAVPFSVDETEFNLSPMPEASSMRRKHVIEISDDEDDGYVDSAAGPSKRIIVKKEPMPVSTPAPGNGMLDYIGAAFDTLPVLPLADPIENVDGLPTLPVVESIENVDDAAVQDLHQQELEMVRLLEEFDANTDAMPQNSGSSNIDDMDVVIGTNADGDSDAEDERQKAAFEKAKRAYNARKKAGTTDISDDIAFQRLKRNEAARRRARKGKKTYAEEEQSMFFPEPQPSSDDEDHVSEMSDVELVDTPATNTAGTTSKRGYAELSRAEGNDVGDQGDETPARSQPAKRGRRGRGGAASRGKADSAPKTAGGSSSAGAKGTRGRPRGSRKGGGRRGQGTQSLFQGVDSLLPYDLLAQANKNREAEAQPTTNQTVRKNALAELIASIPEEARDLHIGDKKLLETSIKMFNGHGAMRADGQGKWRLRGMKTSLHHYQTIGAGRMRERENEGKPSGGMLSDEMGLGKTIMAIANIVDGRADLASVHRATLIVTPAALQSQWLNEITNHGDPKHGFLRNVVIFKASGFLMQNPIEMLSGFDVVITSYHEIIKSYPKREYPKHLVTARAKEEWWEKYFEEHKGILHRVKWHRIILDEAQAIKNHTSRTSEGVWKLRGKYRWTLSGTPVVNSLEEFFAYFRFLKVFATGDFEVWKTNFCKKGSSDALKRLKTMLEKMMIRRTHKDQLFGRPIIQLPPVKPVKTIELEFSVFERALYKIVRDRFVTRINVWKADSTTKHNYTNIFILLLRLRQLTAHMLLIQKTLKDLLQIEDLEKLWSLTNAPEVLSDEVSRQQATGLQGCLDTVNEHDTSANASDRISPGQAPASQEAASSTSATNVDANGDASGKSKEVAARIKGDISQQFRRCLKAMQQDGEWEKINARSVCPVCGQPPKNAHVTNCLHIYCFTCLNELAYEGLMRGDENGTCIECSCKFKKAEAYKVQALDDAARGTPVDVRASKPGKTSASEEDIDWLRITNPIIQSTKTIAAVKQIKEWMQEDDTNKILLFSQFRGVLRIFDKICGEEGWGHAQFHGEMTFDARNKAIDKFTTDPNCKILLAAMKAGGVGLNLTMANRVILIDLWWNVAMETQAFCRVFRIGQTKDVEVVRFAVKNTVDMDILRMQERKTLEIDSAMEKKNRVGKLTTEELLRLFAGMEDTEVEDNGNRGATRRNGNGAGASTASGYVLAEEVEGENEPFIMVDDPYLLPDSDVEEGVEGGTEVDDELQ